MAMGFRFRLPLGQATAISVPLFLFNRPGPGGRCTSHITLSSGHGRCEKFYGVRVFCRSELRFVAKTTGAAPFKVCFVTDTSHVVTEELHFAARTVCFTSKKSEE